LKNPGFLIQSEQLNFCGESEMKKFNITGTCIPTRHYMVDTTENIQETIALIENGEYFIINRPRQYGKTTTFYLIKQELLKKDEYLPIKLSFEGIGDSPFESKGVFCPFFLDYLSNDSLVLEKGYDKVFNKYAKDIDDFGALSKALAKAIKEIGKKVVLMIDEVDKSSNNQIFLHFLGMLREKYLKAAEGDDTTFHSVVLAGVHDVKTLKIKLRSDEERKLNSPWNIATEYKVDMSFKPKQIETILNQYIGQTGRSMDVEGVAQKIYFWTNGYPFLVSKLCKMIDEEFLPGRENKNWEISDVDNAVRQLLTESNTLFDDLGKNLENNKELSDFIKMIVVGGRDSQFVLLDPIINLASIYGIIANKDGRVVIHNKIFAELISSYFASKIMRESFDNPVASNAVQERFLKSCGRLDMEKVVLKFQEVIKEKYSNSDLLKSDEFLEKDLRLLFLVFLKPIINGIGFSFKEVETGAEKRLDIVVVFRDEKFVIELKVWYGQKYHEEGKQRLENYMKAESVDKGFMLIMDKRRSKEFVSEVEDGILMVWI
jgi:hypothetical protein